MRAVIVAALLFVACGRSSGNRTVDNHAAECAAVGRLRSELIAIAADLDSQVSQCRARGLECAPTLSDEIIRRNDMRLASLRLDYLSAVKRWRGSLGLVSLDAIRLFDDAIPLLQRAKLPGPEEALAQRTPEEQERWQELGRKLATASTQSCWDLAETTTVFSHEELSCATIIPLAELWRSQLAVIRHWSTWIPSSNDNLFRTLVLAQLLSVLHADDTRTKIWTASIGISIDPELRKLTRNIDVNYLKQRAEVSRELNIVVAGFLDDDMPDQIDQWCRRTHPRLDALWHQAP